MYICTKQNIKILKTSDRLILVTNDDGFSAEGIKALTEVAREFGRVMVVAPFEGQSGMSHAITVKFPLRLHKLSETDGVEIYACNGTPVDCVKLAFNKLLGRRPDLLLSGINHGSNSAIAVVYSGTMAAAIEGCINGIPSIGFSYLDYSHQADFTACKPYVRQLIQSSITNGLPDNVCLNVNIPKLKAADLKGIKICRQNRGFWEEEFDQRTDPNGRDYFWLTGKYHNLEPEATDTDEFALNQGYVTVVPVHADLTAYHTLNTLKNWGIES